MSLQGNSNDEKIWNYLKSKGLNDFGIAGLMGNLRAESGLNPKNLQNSYETKLSFSDDEYTSKVDDGSYTNFVKDKAGYGLAQWTWWTRKQNLINYAKSQKKSIGDLEMQLNFLWKELSEGYKSVLSVLKSATSVLQASNAVLIQFEKPAVQSKAVQDKRAQYGQEYYEKFSNKGGNNMSNSSLVNVTVKSPNHSGKRTHNIDRITPHCVVGQLSAEAIGGCFTSSSRQASCNYGIGTDGRVLLCVDEENRSWCSSSSANDQRAVTIECASDKTSPYAFNTAVYNKLIDLCVDICKRNGKKKLIWISDKTKALSYTPANDEMQLTVHRWFANKSCPGDWLFNRMSDLASKVTAKLGGTSIPSTGSNTSNKNTSFPATPFSVKVLISDLNIRTSPTSKDDSNLTGKYTGKGTFTIVDVVDGWGLLKSYEKNKNGYIYLENPTYVKVGNTVGSTSTPSKNYKVGDVIKLKAGATYYNDKTIPAWVFNSTLYYRGTNTNGVIFSTQKTGTVTGVVKPENII